MLRNVLVLLVMLAGVVAAQAEEPTLELIGGQPPIALSPGSVAALPAIERDVAFATSKGASTAHYRGVLLWDVLRANKVLDGLDLSAQLGRTILVTARDGYRVAFSIGEIHPDFGNLPLLLVTAIDGQPLAQGWRLVAPGDKRGARAVRDVTRIELK